MVKADLRVGRSAVKQNNSLVRRRAGDLRRSRCDRRVHDECIEEYVPTVRVGGRPCWNFFVDLNRLVIIFELACSMSGRD